MKNKKADLAVTLLVFMAVALAGAASIIFISSDRKIEDKITDARFLDEIYVTEGQLDFYINEIMEKAAVKDRTQEEIISDFSAELEKYKDKNGNYVLQELSQVEGQISNIKVEDNKVTAEFTISLEDKVIVKEKKAEKELFSAVYTYKKKFEKEISVLDFEEVSGTELKEIFVPSKEKGDGYPYFGKKEEGNEDNYFGKSFEEVLFIGDKSDLEIVRVYYPGDYIGEKHTLTLVEIKEDSVVLLIESSPIKIPVKMGEEEKVDVDDDGFYDTILRLTSINADGSVGLEKKYTLERRNEEDKRYEKVEEPKKSSHVLFKMDKVYLDIVSFYVNSKGERNIYVNYIAFLDLLKGEEANLIVGPESAYFKVGESKKFEIKDKVDGESSGYYNLKSSLESINSDGSVTITKEYIHEKIPPKEKDIIIEEKLPKEVPGESLEEEIQKSEERKKSLQRELKELYRVDYVSNEIVEEYRRHIPCGPYALYPAFKALGFDISIESINEQRVGGLRRGFLSIFDENSKFITWPDEMVNIPKKYGFEVEVIRGKKASVETIIQKSDEGVVISLLGLKSELFPNHYEDYSELYYIKSKIKENPEFTIKDFGYPSFYSVLKRGYSFSINEDWKIHELYVIKKRIN